MMIDSDGQVRWVPHGVYISSCPIDIRWFPFDTQLCTLKFGSWAYNTAKLNLTSRSNTIDLNTYQVNGEWEIIGEKYSVNHMFNLLNFEINASF